MLFLAGLKKVSVHAQYKQRLPFIYGCTGQPHPPPDLDYLVELEDLESPPPSKTLPAPQPNNSTSAVQSDSNNITAVMETSLPSSTNQNPAMKSARQKPPPRPPSTYTLIKEKVLKL